VGAWRASWRLAEYRQAVARVHDAIARGETYQVNLTFPLRAAVGGDLRAWYRDLREAQGPGMAARIDLGTDVILSLSPELFFHRAADRVVVRPMKGTAPRGRWAEEDEAAGRALAACPKNRAENVMITDLLRNDLGRIACPGTVRVRRLFEVERRPTLWQMTSTVEARLPPGTRLSALLRALFPCGSVTGAPKARTMRWIRDLETGPRGFYCGGIGLLRPGGDALFSVPIRTLTVDRARETVRIPVGSGVVWDSDADAEYRECLLKARFARLRPARFRLLETLRLEDGRFALLRRHLARLRASARYFGWPWPSPSPMAALRAVRRAHPAGLWRVRLIFARGGTARAEAYPLPAVTPPRRIALANRPVRSGDIRLYHKTTRRGLYTRALRAVPEADDVVLWNERGDVTESCLASLIVTIEGRALTPPVSAGLLPGTARADLLHRGAVTEAALRIEDLRKAESVELVNSVRGRMRTVWLSEP